MSQNTSSAVMAQRKEPHDSLDDFPTQPWGTRAFVEHVLQPIGVTPEYLKVWEPAANRGYMARPLSEYFGEIRCSDIHDYGAGYYVHDFLQPYLPADVANIDWVISNPPFRLGLQFIERALEIAQDGVAVIMRSSFSEGIERYNRLYHHNPPTVTACYAERLPMVRGRIDRKASSATAYSWFVWRKNCERLPSIWIPPCRRKLERPGDYDAINETPASGNETPEQRAGG